MNFNQIIIIGNLTRAPELTYLPNQTPVCDFGIANNRKYKDKNGNQKDDVCFIDCRGFGKTAETMAKYLEKGAPVLIRGKLQFDQWEAQDGSKRSKHRIMVDAFEFVPTKKEATTQAGPPDATEEPQFIPDDSDCPF